MEDCQFLSTYTVILGDLDNLSLMDTGFCILQVKIHWFNPFLHEFYFKSIFEI